MRLFRILLLTASALLWILGLALLLHILDPLLAQLIARSLSLPAKSSWLTHFHQAGAWLLALGLATLVCALWVLPRWVKLAAGAGRSALALDGWFDRRLGRWLDIDDGVPARFTWPRLNWIDALILAGFLAYGLLIFVGSIQGNYPNLLLGGDEANTASFAAGFDHPELFRGDMLLGQPGNFAAYSTFNVAFMRWVEPLVGSYSLALDILIPVQIFLYLEGFYFFGRVLFRKRGWALLLALMMTYSVPLNLGEGWGIILSAAARSQFTAVLPIVLSLLLIWKDRPSRWPWIMAATGLLIYLHPISTPVWAVAIWLTLWVSAPRDWSLPKKFGVLFAMGCVFLVTTAPYVITYLSNHTQGKSVNYNLVAYVFANYMPPHLLDVPAYGLDYLHALSVSGLLVLPCAGLVATLVLMRKRLASAGLVLLWMASILLVSVLLPWAILTVERYLNMLPTVSELERGLRYLVPWLFLFCLWPFVELSRRARTKKMAGFLAVAATALVLAWGLSLPPSTNAIQHAFDCLRQGALVCPQVTDYDRMLATIRDETPTGAPIYATFANDPLRTYGMSIRYTSLHPLVYSFKDRGLLVYTNDQELTQWYDAYQVVESIEQDFTQFAEKTYVAPAERLNRHIELARQLGARYIVTDFPTDLTALGMPSVTVVAANPGFTLLKIQ